MFLAQENGAGLLRYSLASGEQLDRFTLEALRQNPIEGIAVPGLETLSEERHILFPVAGLVSVSQYAKETEKEPEQLLQQLLCIKRTVVQYMVPEDELLLRPEWTYVDRETGQPTLLVLPVDRAEDLSLSWEDYETLVRSYFPKQVEEHRGRNSGTSHEKESANGKDPYAGKPLKEKIKLFWNGLDQDAEQNF